MRRRRQALWRPARLAAGAACRGACSGSTAWWLRGCGRVGVRAALQPALPPLLRPPPRHAALFHRPMCRCPHPAHPRCSQREYWRERGRTEGPPLCVEYGNDVEGSMFVEQDRLGGSRWNLNVRGGGGGGGQGRGQGGTRDARRSSRQAGMRYRVGEPRFAACCPQPSGARTVGGCRSPLLLLGLNILPVQERPWLLCLTPAGGAHQQRQQRKASSGAPEHLPCSTLSWPAPSTPARSSASVPPPCPS